jgi:predicted permease
LLLPANMGAGLDFGLDYRIFLFTAGLSVITGVLFGLAPALRASKPALIPVLKKEAGVPMGRFGLRNALVTGQIALSLTLLIGAGLFVRSLRNAAATDLGFDPENLLIASIDLQNDIRSPDQAVSRYDEILERIKTLPGVRSAALAWSIPVSGGGSRTSFQIDGYTPQPKEDMELNYNVVGLGYFSTLGIPLVQGRDFTPQDRAGGVDVVIVNEAFAQRYFAGQNPLGRSVRRSGTVCEIIGLVKTGRYRNLRESPLPYVYMAFAQGPHATMSVVMRTAGDPVGLIPAVRAEIRHVNRNIPVYNISTMSDVVRERLAFDRMITVLSGVFGGIALVLASIGLYGVTAYAVAQRTREIGIRMALGAQKGDVLRLILRHGMGMAGAGVALGLAVAFGVTRLVSAMLYDVSATDLATFIAVSLLLALVALLACYLPARRATRVDPLAALRYE